ncbi:MAG TPA: PDZ domain-containing protein [Bacteroidia bacterium]|nr:PDZ domain-containing protein [Bacteroidia bacterium]
MEYYFSVPDPQDRFINIQAVFTNESRKPTITIKLPSWRPGRYELAHFSKNIKGFKALKFNGDETSFKKTARDTWEINTDGQGISVVYRYYAAQLDAGACWADNYQLYVNPVHCCVFDPDQLELPCVVHLELPEGWITATGMNKKDERTLYAGDHHELFDSPFICSPELKHAAYSVDDIRFHIWMQGDADPDWNRIVKDFEAFTKLQIQSMTGFPAPEFHFLVQLTPYPFYHGVEHLKSTVLALGPGYKLMQDDIYNDFLGVASHELFHCWNVKTIRPVEMLPYDYTRENYAETGYVYEGVTTYFGDLYLARSGFFNLQQLLDEYSSRLQKHLDNPGRYNYSVAESSFDTWLDGYVPGIPGRKVSIYDEGCLLALAMDFMIRSATHNMKSLDDVMRVLYIDFGLKGIGYSAADYKSVCEKTGGRSFDAFFNEYVNAPASYEHLLEEVLSLAGLEIQYKESAGKAESLLGIKTEQRNQNTIVTAVYPGSPAYNAGLIKDDELISFNGTRIAGNLDELCAFKTFDTVEIITSTSRKIVRVQLDKQQEQYYKKARIVSAEQLTMAQVQFRDAWLNISKPK